MRKEAAISLVSLSKTYPSGQRALNNISFEIERGEIFALLGPNGAGKTTLINSICGVVNITEGHVFVAGMDVKQNKIDVKRKIGMVPQETSSDALETVESTVKFSHSLYGKPRNPEFINRILRQLSLWEVRKSRVMTLSGGMKRRVMIAKALVHEPEILFLDEPSAGVDVEARHSMWALIRSLRDSGVTVILTTHYIEEAEALADRVAIINKGEIVLTEKTQTLLRRFGGSQLILQLTTPMEFLPADLHELALSLSKDGQQLIYDYQIGNEELQITKLLRFMAERNVGVTGLQSKRQTLEDVFVKIIQA